MTKEYPATHSMSTAWFIADADGKEKLTSLDYNGLVAALKKLTFGSCLPSLR